MGRKTDPTARYRVSIHVNGGYRYACTQPSMLDTETGKRRYQRIHWGTVDENLKFRPGKQYIAASPEEREKLIFPESWDLSEINKLPGRRKKWRAAIEGQHDNRLYGDIWLLEQIAEAVGIRSDILRVFGGNTEMADIIMTLAIFLICGKGTCSQLAAWQRIAKAPYSEPLDPPLITEVMQSITEQNRVDLLRLWTARYKRRSLCVVDSVSCVLGDPFADIRDSNANDRFLLVQPQEVVVYTLDDHVPVYYRAFTGSVLDSMGLDAIMRNLDSAGLKDVVLITDRGYESIRNLETYIDRGQPMIMGTKISQSYILSRVKAFGVFDHRPEEMEIDVDNRIYYCQYEFEYRNEGSRDKTKPAAMLRLNLYFDSERRSRELTDIDIAIACQRRELEQKRKKGCPLDDDRTIARAYNFYRLEYDKASRVLKDFTLDADKVTGARNKAGFFANTTYKIDGTAMESLRHYSLCDEQEKFYAIMKGIIGYDCQRNLLPSYRTGRSFILFVARVLWCCLSNVRATKLKEEFDSVADLLYEMRPIRYIERKGEQPYITPFVGKQVTVCEAFGLGMPEDCVSEYADRKTKKGGHGRTRKNKIVAKEDHLVQKIQKLRMKKGI